MKALFVPARIFMGNMRFTAKFMTIFVIIMIPLIILSYNMISVLNDDISFLENEKRGLLYLKTVRLPMQYIQQHRGMTAAYTNGASQFKSRIMDKRLQVDKFFVQLQKMEGN